MNLRRGLAALINFVLALLALGLLFRGAPAGARLGPEPGLPDYAAALGVGAVLGALSFGIAGRGAARGAAFGFVCGWLGVYAWLWRLAAEGWRLLGWFAGPLAIALLPFALTASILLAWYSLADEEARNHAALILGILLSLWIAPAQLAHWRLRERGYGPRSMVEATGALPAAAAETVAVASLRPSTAAPYALETRTLAVEGLSADPASLDALYRYLEATHYGGVFARQALAALRKGWLARWEPERALQADMLAFPKRAAPDYRGALGLIRAGALVPERFARLRALSDLADESPAGFEDVNQSQYIFEGFSAGFARFGDEDRARQWILRVDNLWPIYEKKVEVTALEYFREGEIAGSVEDGVAPASGVRVGLFYVGESTGAVDNPGVLSQAAPVDELGRFRFAHLGAGSYFLGLMASTATLSGPIRNSPSLIEVSPETPFVALPPVRLSRASNL